MINVKGGTQTWSSSPQRADFKSDNAHNVSASDQAKFFDGESAGDTANRIADPNFVAEGKKMRTVGNAQLGKDAFMTLLLTQMKNQDPTNPMKSHEMAAQLAQFTSLEKLNNINDGISALRKDNQPDHNFQALSLIGKSVNMDNSKIVRNDESESHDLRFSLPADATKATIEIKDGTGNVIRKMEAKALKAGPNSIQWNGKTEEGSIAPKGDYTLSVEAFGSNGKKLYVQTRADGIITGVNFTAHGPQLLMGKQTISLADVKSITDPNVGEHQKAMPMTMPGGNTTNIPVPPQLGGTPPGQGDGAANEAPSDEMIKAAMAKAMQAAAAGGGPRMMAINGGPMAANGQPGLGAESREPVHHTVVKPETKSNEAKRARLSKGSVNDSAMSQGLINTLNKEGAKAGMGS